MRFAFIKVDGVAASDFRTRLIGGPPLENIGKMIGNCSRAGIFIL